MPLYAGFDCSTQSLSAVVIDSDRREVVYRDSCPFAKPFESSADGATVQASPRVWREALEAGVARLSRNIDRQRLRALSGSAQQHGSVYCGKTPEVLARELSPIWMDSSTIRECTEIEEAIGGPLALARLTGSRAFPRFTGPQIRKVARQAPEAYARTDKIHLVSSYLASVLVGRHTAIDHADGSGMNLMDIRARTWSPAALDATAPELLRRLPPLVPSSTIIGNVNAAWQQRYGLPPVSLVAWSGDNPCALVGTGLIDEGQLAISLGTSDTIFGPMNDPRVSSDGTGHVFASPLGAYMGITVFRNGSLARERVRNEFALTWPEFSEALRTTPPGNGGAMMLPWFDPEITPHVPQGAPARFGLGASAAGHVRAIIEAQAMALARHSEWMGVVPETIYATGGAAANREILQVVADVFDAEVFQFESTDAAALGAALRAMQSDTGQSWQEVVQGFVSPIPSSRVAPDPSNVALYRRLRDVYAARERDAVSGRS